jgi:hypothetical protein
LKTQPNNNTASIQDKLQSCKQAGRLGSQKSFQKVGKSLIDHTPRLRHNLAMNNEYQQYMKELQIQSLRNKQHQMDFLLTYEIRMQYEAQDPDVREFHQHPASDQNEAHAYPDKLLHTLEGPSPS